jgi:hypothetical protein
MHNLMVVFLADLICQTKTLKLGHWIEKYLKVDRFNLGPMFVLISFVDVNVLKDRQQPSNVKIAQHFRYLLKKLCEKKNNKNFHDQFFS